jgi:hypothetical protein
LHHALNEIEGQACRARDTEVPSESGLGNRIAEKSLFFLKAAYFVTTNKSKGLR